ncbi:MAG TPA: carboxypeptidase regulatory-like domain-containing protein, partial [Thermoplasmata archaeon]|nr:carboxypeptidase regulatory-like domain-containing protein [Thermoplasmata archaeon]
MAAPRIPLRCTQCGASVDLPPPAGPATSWSSCPQCGHPMPVVPWRERAPLFSWEVFPHLYPPLPPPRIPSKGVRPALLALLIAGAVALGGLSAVTAAEGAFALGPGTVTVSGSVVAASAPSSPPGAATPLSGAHVTVQYTGGPPRTALTGGAGTFEFSGVPPGGITLNASAKGYSGESLV